MYSVKKIVACLVLLLLASVSQADGGYPFLSRNNIQVVGEDDTYLYIFAESIDKIDATPLSGVLGDCTAVFAGAQYNARAYKNRTDSDAIVATLRAAAGGQLPVTFQVYFPHGDLNGVGIWVNGVCSGNPSTTPDDDIPTVTIVDLP